MKQIIYIDASSLKESGGCPRKWYYNSVVGLQPNGITKHVLQYGNAFHYFLKDYYSGLDPARSITKAVQWYSDFLATMVSFPDYFFHTADHLDKMLNKYLEIYPKATDLLIPVQKQGEPLVEKKFAIPWFHTDRYEYILCGTVDLIVTYMRSPCIVDHKTMAKGMLEKADKQLEKFYQAFELDIQSLMYVYIYTKYNNLDKIPGFVVNAAVVNKPTVGATKAGVFDGVTFGRSPILEITREKLDLFETWLNSWKDKILSLLDQGSIEDHLELTNCNAKYGLCKYFKICSKPTELKSSIIESFYQILPYEPLNFRN